MNEAKYPSKERVERDGVLVHAEGDDLLNDPEEAKRQGYKIGPDAEPEIAVERIERDGVLIAAEGAPLPADEDQPAPAKRARKATKKS